MPNPVVALACESRSTTSTRRPRAANAVARLTAVVVLPTPPFWLATAMMRARPTPATARGSASVSARLTDHLLQREHASARIGAALMTRDGLHCPGFAGGGQFLLGLRALEKKTGRERSDKPFRQRQKPVERSAAAGGDDIDRMCRDRLDPAGPQHNIDPRRIRAASRRKAALRRVGLDQFDPGHAGGSPAPARETRRRRCRDRPDCARPPGSAAGAGPNRGSAGARDRRSCCGQPD